MRIFFNSELVDVDGKLNLLDFLQAHLRDSDTTLVRSVVAVNQQLVPKHAYSEYQLIENDEIELLTAMVGG